MTDALQLSSQCSRSAVQILQQSQLVYVLTEIFPLANTAGQRLPLNFVLLLDHSGSMAGDKIRTMRLAVNRMIEQLTPEDILAIVTFETRTEVLVPAGPVVDKEELFNKIERIQDAGGTNLAPALMEGLNQISEFQSPDFINRMILLTDGEATDREDDSRTQADLAGKNGVPIIGLGFGRDWNEDFIIELADRSLLAEPGSQSGIVEYIPTPDDAVNIFEQVYRSMQVVARDVTVHTRMVQGLEARRVWQVVPMIKDLGPGATQGRAIVLPIGDLEKGGAAYLAEIMLPPRPTGLVRIAQTDAEYTLANGERGRQAVDLIVSYTDDEKAARQLNENVMNIVEKVQAFKLQTQALNEAEMGDIHGATRKLRQAVTILLTQGEVQLADKIQREADRLDDTGTISSEGRKTIKLSSRKTIKLSEE